MKYDLTCPICGAHIDRCPCGKKAGVLAVLLSVLMLSGCGATAVTVVASFASPSDVPVPAKGPVVFIGDSITYAWTLPSTYVNAAVPVQVGYDQTSDDMLGRFQRDVLALAPSVVEILGGTNDLRNSASPSADSVIKMGSEASAAGACVILSTIPPSTDLAVTPYITSQVQMDQVIYYFNGRVTYYATINGYQLADYHAAMVNPDGSQNTALFDLDGMHPNAAGYAVMWSVAQPLIEQCQLGEVPG